MVGKNYTLWMGVLLIINVALAGCGKAGMKASEGDFASAAPELKAVWEKTVAADKANDYITAVVGYDQLLHERNQLSERQVKLLQEASRKFFQRLMAASRQGNPVARQAYARLREMERQRP